jgi:metal-responsive CopG/Arc/MetJ family transcriptional regulator
MQTKRKVSVTVPEDRLAEVDRLAGALSRSAIFEQALVSWLRRHRQADLDRSIERYYRFLNQEERAEDAEWAALGDETVRNRWAESDE